MTKREDPFNVVRRSPIVDHSKGAPVYWVAEPPKLCDVCREPIRKTFADAKTRNGAWGKLDLKCLRIHGIGTGKGKGQLYRLQDDNRWLKVEG